MSLSVHIRKKLDAFILQADFDIDSGVAGLLGMSGSGKSMTLKCIAGIETPDEGRIVLDGVTLFDSEKKINVKTQDRHVGYLFQNYALYPHMTVKQNILLGLHAEKELTVREESLKKALRSFRIEDIADKKPPYISGGQAQRTALARIMVNRPKVLLLDEPFSALDAHLRLQMQLEMKQVLKAYEGDVLMVTHSREEAYHLCDEIAVTEEGRIGALRKTKELFADPKTFNAARITGCKNIAHAEKTGPREVFVPEWNVHFTTDKEVRDDIKGVAFRAHYLHPRTEQNRYPVTFAGELEQPFEWVLLYRYAGQREDTEPVWWRLPKDKRPQTFPEALGIAPVNILLLYEQEEA